MADNMLEKIEEIKQEALQKLGSIDNDRDMGEWRIHYLGKKSLLTQILRSLGTLSKEERKTAGATANQVKALLEENAAQTSEARNLRDLVQELADPPKSAGEP